MTPQDFILDPWKERNAHELYTESFLNMRPAPEYASGEVLLASVYRNVGFSEKVSEGKVPALGRDLAKRLERGRRPGGGEGTGIGMDTWRTLLSGALSSPKQPNQTARRFLQLCPLVPDAAIYSLSARLSSNSWNPGEMVARLVGFGEPDHSRVRERWRDLFHQLSIGQNDDVWAKFLQKEFASWRSDDLRAEWRQPESAGSWPAIDRWHQGAATIPAKQFVHDLDHTLVLKQNLTRRQWISLVESILRLGAASHVLWLCRAGGTLNSAITSVLNGEPPLTEASLRRKLEVGAPLWRYSQVAGRTIKDYAREFVMSRLAINLLLWHCQALHNATAPPIPAHSLSSIPSLAAFLSYLASIREQLRPEEYRQHLHKAIDENPRVVAGKEGIGSNISEFLRHVLGQRQTSEAGMDSYDQGYYLRKRGNYKTAPWIVSLGPVSVLSLVHCCTHRAKGPRTVEDFCRHLANYGIEIRAQDVPRSDLGQTLRNLGLVLDSPDAEGGMVLVSPFKSVITGEQR
jgi:hypothetical protein